MHMHDGRGVFNIWSLEMRRPRFMALNESYIAYAGIVILRCLYIRNLSSSRNVSTQLLKTILQELVCGFFFLEKANKQCLPNRYYYLLFFI